MTDLYVSDSSKRESLTALAAATERDSEHPVARAITAFGQEKVERISTVEEFESIPVHEIRCKIDSI
ncbi:hypothetical protein [Sporosarcina sp. D27]|uniref:hypothetical protein n=1 Tax=Sporosarcina sp. D27 TaxID=1382305 RepID=UPI00046E822A|nr:hypothetical protein [Sporosarcina sp. D27]